MDEPREPGTKREDREEAVSHLLEEGRTILPGIQALFGFQLMAVFSQGFRELPRPEQLAHYGAITLVSVCVALVLSPPAYHRQTEPRTISDGFLRWAGRAIGASLAPLALALALDLEVVGYAIVDDRAVAALIAAATLLLCAGLWFVVPAFKRRAALRERNGQLAGA
jgi:hypothetical protein